MGRDFFAGFCHVDCCLQWLKSVRTFPFHVVSGPREKTVVNRWQVHGQPRPIDACRDPVVRSKERTTVAETTDQINAGSERKFVVNGPVTVSRLTPVRQQQVPTMGTWVSELDLWAMEEGGLTNHNFKSKMVQEHSKFKGVDLASKFTRYVQTSPIIRGPTSRITGLQRSAVNILVPDTAAHWSGGVHASIV